MKRSLLLFILFLSLTNGGQAQISVDSVLDQSVEALSQYYQTYPNEKIYLHFDKLYYLVGDDIWFKAYVTLGNQNLLSNYSKILYVELINEASKIVRTLRLPVTAGISFGDFHLGDSLDRGSYRIRAYTQWMRNFGTDYYFDRSFQIERAGSASDPAIVGDDKKENASLSSESTLAVFPESGTLQADILNRVGFVFADANGRGLAGSGELRDETGHVITEVNTSDIGIGDFVFIPRRGKQYTLSLQDSLGNNQSVRVDNTRFGSHSLTVNALMPNSVIVQINTEPAAVHDQRLNMIVQQNGDVYYVAKVKINKPAIIVHIPKNRLGNGVSEVTLFSEEMQPLAYRSVFHQKPERVMPLALEFDKEQYHTREKVTVSLLAGVRTDSLRIGSFSVSVINLDQLPDVRNEHNIFSSLLLRESINMYVQTPASYFTDDSYALKKELDDLMLTLPKDEVWTRLTKKDIQFPVEEDMHVSGLVTRYNGKPEPNAKVTLFSPQAGLVIDTVADENGRFSFDRLLFYDSVHFVIQARTPKGKKHLELTLDNVPEQGITRSKNSSDLSLHIGKSIQQYIDKNKAYYEALYRSGQLQNSILLNEVKVTAGSDKYQHSSNLNGPGNADQVITADELSTCPSLDMCLQGRLMGVIFKNGIPYSTRSMNIPMRIILDGMPMEPEFLSSISPMDVAFIEVLRRPSSTAIYGSMGTGGVLVITTKRGDGGYVKNAYSPGVVTYSPQGFYQIRDFQSPDYSRDEHADKADLRTTIYWKPNLVTNKNGETSFSFYTSDRPGTYRVIVEGIDLNGRIGRLEEDFQVKK